MKFSKGEINLATKYNLDLTKNDESPTHIAQNPISGVEVKLNSVQVTLYCATMDAYAKWEQGTGTSQTFDRLKYLFLKLNPNAYYDLVD